jgi:ABC-2 type transport system ATP-binding protein
LLDEPTTGLDPNARREIWNILRKLKSELQTSMILTTHYMEEAEELCDYIIIMDHGKVLLEGTLQDLLGGSPDKAEPHISDPGRKSLDDLFTSLTGRHLDE